MLRCLLVPKLVRYDTASAGPVDLGSEMASQGFHTTLVETRRALPRVLEDYF